MKKKQVEQVYDWNNKQKSMVTYKRTRKVNWFRVARLIIYILLIALVITFIITWITQSAMVVH